MIMPGHHSLGSEENGNHRLGIYEMHAENKHGPIRLERTQGEVKIGLPCVFVVTQDKSMTILFCTYITINLVGNNEPKFFQN